MYPDVPARAPARVALRRGRFRVEAGARGPLGLGTEFESVRDYLPDDDIRQINWRATARLGRPMSNQYRVEQDRDVVCLLDGGRLMAAPARRPAPGSTPAIDAAVAVAVVADELGDRCGALAFDARAAARSSAPAAPRRACRRAGDLRRRAGASTATTSSRSAAVGGLKRALVLVFTDLLDEAAAQPLLDAVPVLARRHAVVVASVARPDLAGAGRPRAGERADVYRAAVALDVLAARARTRRAACAARAPT